MNLQQIIAMTTKKHEEEEVYQKIYFLKIKEMKRS